MKEETSMEKDEIESERGANNKPGLNLNDLDIDSDGDEHEYYAEDDLSNSDEMPSEDDFFQEITGVRPRPRKLPNKRENPNLRLVYMAYRR